MYRSASKAGQWRTGNTSSGSREMVYYSIPIFQLANRNLNEWWVDRNKNFKLDSIRLYRSTRPNFRAEMKIDYLCFTELQLWGFNYYMPNLSKNGKIGASFLILQMMQSKRMAYMILIRTSWSCFTGGIIKDLSTSHQIDFTEISIYSIT